MLPFIIVTLSSLYSSLSLILLSSLPSLQLPHIPPLTTFISFLVMYREVSASSSYGNWYETSVNGSTTLFTYVLPNLQRNHTYEVSIKGIGKYHGFTYILGNMSNPVNLSTNVFGMFIIHTQIERTYYI